jgi:hypothetical protein
MYLEFFLLFNEVDLWLDLNGTVLLTNLGVFLSELLSGFAYW